MAHYFDSNPEVAPQTEQVSVTLPPYKWELLSERGVFSRRGLDIGTRALLTYLQRSREEINDLLPLGTTPRILDLGCGLGVISLLAAKLWPGASFTALDINRRAVALATQNLARYHVRAEVLESDGFSSLPDARFDLILTNPPVRVGKAKLYELLTEAYSHLTPGGVLLLVLGKKQGAESARRFLSETCSAADLVAHQSGFHVLRLQAPVEP